MTRLARLAICVSLGLFAAGAWAVSAAAQVPPSRLQTIDVYRTAQLDADAVKRRYAPAIRELVAGINANDEPTIARLHEEIVESVRASADFAFVALNVTTGFERDENAVYVSIEVVDPADAEARLSFDTEPAGSVADPDGVLDAWEEYQRTAVELIQTRQIEPRVEDCPAHHCVVGFAHEALAPFLERFDRGAREHHDALVRVLREDANSSKRANAVFVLAHVEDARQLVHDLVPSLDDPASGVRNNVMRVLIMVAQVNGLIDIPFEPLARRIDDPDSGCRNKAAYVIAALARRPEYRDNILAIAPAVLRLLRLEKPNNHDPAYEILKTISGEEHGERDYARWEEWIARHADAVSTSVRDQRAELLGTELDVIQSAE
jgi:hypothetical protein